MSNPRRIVDEAIDVIFGLERDIAAGTVERKKVLELLNGALTLVHKATLGVADNEDLVQQGKAVFRMIAAAKNIFEHTEDAQKHIPVLKTLRLKMNTLLTAVVLWHRGAA